MAVPISGTCDPAFAEVRDAFAANFADRGEVGAAVCVRVGGRPVVDLAGGWADAERTRPWQTDTLVNVYSVGKAFVGLLALQLVDEGRIQLDTPIAEVWPEFDAAGKHGATVRHALCHRAGVPAIREPLTDADLWSWQRMTDALAATAPWWEPGTAHAYHTNTYGHLVGGIVHRATGDLPSVRLRRVTDGVRADVWFGVPGPERHRCADVIWDPSRPMPTGIDPDQLEGETQMLLLGYVNPPGYSSAGVVNSAEWRRAEIPSTNGHATAGGIAAIYSALLEPGRLLSPDLLAEATRVQSEGWCPVLAEDSRFGLGFKPTVAHRPFGPNPNSFGHFGTGGAVGFADPDAGVAFGYAMNHVIPRWQSTRNRSLIDAVYRCL
ncbi:MAG: serine hydrolase domain-containing protein [Actinomycetes bacterium]